ncbi:hypothetical protein GSI_01484 [Ganoderma sinense ZZ0214-1]|uniref:Uncharacterized protein n=1 Tax=Ganoderma sinense ZZ0214-1 TaxID=1077348 RepID=A0A2G8SPY7_9APHY|nr:hypothetical protein GSI_01484 [Ganoderma sinense ZZ0214-1]
MPVTFNVADEATERISRPKNSCQTVEDFFKASCYREWEASGEMIQSSVAESDLPKLKPQKNGFVHTVVEAYGRHHHLRIRPDDVWIAILSQLSFYVNKHAEELRKYFVAHEGKKELCVQAVGTRYTVDFGHIAVEMSSQVRKNIVDKTLVEWILPDFTTSTPQDIAICAVLLMSTLQKYFKYKADFICGIPSVTLEGEKADWEKLYKRLDRLPGLGSEPEQWAAMLRPILRRFVDAFDGNPDITFWKHVVHRNQMCGYDGLSGWITAFCVWDMEGKWLAHDRTAGTVESSGSVMATRRSYSDPFYTLDGVPYFSLDMGDIPVGYSEVDVLVDDNGLQLKCKMVSGHVASVISEAVKDGPSDTFESRPSMVYICYELHS